MKKSPNILLQFGIRKFNHTTLHRLSIGFISLIFFGMMLTGCDESSTNDGDNDTEPTVVEVTAFHNMETGEHEFVTDVEEIPSGWTTFRLINQTAFTHFLFLDHLPDGKTEVDMGNEIYPVFQAAAYLIKEGKFEEANAEFANLPPWSAEIVYRGGVGFVSGGNTAETTLYVEPGSYVMECYVMDAEGTYHYTSGMYRGFNATEEMSEAVEPDDADIQMDVSSEGFGMQGSLSAGEHKVAVSFVEPPAGLLGYDVHLARLDEDTDINEVAMWMDSATPQGLISDTGMPAPAEFLGGAHDMPVGNTAYFTIDLEPGRYAWISEQPSNASIYEEFTISNE